MTRKLLCLKEIPKPDDTADALAMAICHGQASGSALRQSLCGRTVAPTAPRLARPAMRPPTGDSGTADIIRSMKMKMR